MASKRLKSDDERQNLFRGDRLICQACGRTVWSADPSKNSFTYREIDTAYFNHVRRCFSLKRLLVTQRNGNQMAPLEPDNQ